MHKSAKFLLTLYVFVFLCNMMYKYAVCVKIRSALTESNRLPISRFVNNSTTQQLNNSTTKHMNSILLQATSVATMSNWDKFIEALILMCIGMLTVFTVLMIIIGMGKALIALVNKFFPEEVKPVAKAAQAVQAVDQNIQEAINKAIMTLSGGKQSAQKIEKL